MLEKLAPSLRVTMTETTHVPNDSTAQLTAKLRDTQFRLNQALVQQEALYHAGLALGATLQVEEVIGEILPLAVSMVDARSGFLFLRDERSRRFSLVHEINLTTAQQDVLGTDVARKKLRQVMSMDTPLYCAQGTLPGDLGGHHLLVVCVGEAGFIGVIDKESRQGVRGFDEEDGHLLELMGRQAGTALVNARLYRSVREERNLNQNIFSSIANGLISTDAQGAVVQINPAVQRIFASEQNLIGKSSARLFQRYGCKRIATALKDTLTDGRERPIDGEYIEAGNLTLNARITALRDTREQIQGVVIALEDLTAQTRIRQMFSQYASDQLVDLVLENDTQPALGGEERQATMLFVDLVGSTELLDQIGAESMVSTLNDCFTRLVDIIFNYNGAIDKYLGDGFLAVYGAPMGFPDDTERAVHSALAMREEMERFNRAHHHHLAVKIGISQGRVLAGNIGSLRRMEYTVTGPSVNLASRLCDHALASEIIAGPNVYNELSERFAFEHLGAKSFKGLRQPIEIYQVIGPPGARSKARPREEKSTMTEKPTRVDLSIPMLPDMELTAVKTATAIGEYIGLEKEKIEEVKMALVEACINAFEHSQSKDRRLNIDFDSSGGALTIVISDRGHGFDVEEAQDRVKQRRQSGEKRRGWGLRLMEELMDEVHIESGQNGTRLILVKRI